MSVFIGDWLPLVLMALGILLVVRVHQHSLAGPSRGWRRFYLVLRLIVVLLLGLALMDMQARQTGDTRAVIVCLDRSRSIPPDLRDAAENYVRRSDAPSALSRS